jgi:hypothetical protein
MKTKIVMAAALIAALLVVASSVAMASSAESNKPASLVAAVRQATGPFRDVEKATAAGYGMFHGCTSGAQEGAMGIHFANGNLVGDGAIDAAHPEVLMYEPKNGKLELLGVEYLVLADAWNAKNDAPPVLMGQMFNFVGAPNRYRLPAFYELHVWAWKSNPSGMFADFNTRVSCEDFNGAMDHH